MAVSNHISCKASKHYYRLSAFHDPTHAGQPRLEIHITRAQAAQILKQAALPAGQRRGWRFFHVSVFVGGRAFSKLHVETHASHRRRCAARADIAPWVLR